MRGSCDPHPVAAVAAVSSTVAVVYSFGRRPGPSGDCLVGLVGVPVGEPVDDPGAGGRGERESGLGTIGRSISESTGRTGQHPDGKTKLNTACGVTSRNGLPGLGGASNCGPKPDSGFAGSAVSLRRLQCERQVRIRRGVDDAVRTNLLTRRNDDDNIAGRPRPTGNSLRSSSIKPVGDLRERCDGYSHQPPAASRHIRYSATRRLVLNSNLSLAVVPVSASVISVAETSNARNPRAPHHGSQLLFQFTVIRSSKARMAVAAELTRDARSMTSRSEKLLASAVSPTLLHHVGTSVRTSRSNVLKTANHSTPLKSALTDSGVGMDRAAVAGRKKDSLVPHSARQQSVAQVRAGRSN